jgi:hypothetical protein
VKVYRQSPEVFSPALEHVPVQLTNGLARVLWLVLERCAEKRAAQPQALSKIQVTGCVIS